MSDTSKRVTMTLEQAIAKQLAASNVGLFRKQLFDKIDKQLTIGNIEKVRMALNYMKIAGHVEKSARIGLDGSRWSITPKGRAAYSVMHDDDLHGEDLSPEQVDQKLAELSEGIGGEVKTHFDDDSDESAAHHDNIAAGMQVKDAIDALTVYGDRFKSIEFDTNDELDRGLFGIVELIRNVASQPSSIIERKSEKINLIESLSMVTFLSQEARELLTAIRIDLEQLEQA